MAIPIHNIYYLLCYAWNKLEEKDIVSVGNIDKDKVVDLFARVLNTGVSHLLRKGLDRGYVLHGEETGTIRGKINFPITLRRNFFKNPRIHCEYDELSHNILHNQILKSTLRMLIYCEDIDEAIHEELLLVYRRLHGIDEIPVRKKHFRLVQLNRNNYFYDFLLKICELVIDNLLISDEGGKSKFRDFLQEEGAMSMLFEEFVRSFYKREQAVFKVSRENIPWDAIPIDTVSAGVLPSMQTDISLSSEGRKIVIDTKYYKEALRTYHDVQKVREGNLYQLFAYLKNLEPRGKENLHCEGMLLYPTVEKELNLRYDVQGHRISIRTINLNQDWKQIHNNLLDILN